MKQPVQIDICSLSLLNHKYVRFYYFAYREIICMFTPKKIATLTPTDTERPNRRCHNRMSYCYQSCTNNDYFMFLVCVAAIVLFDRATGSIFLISCIFAKSKRGKGDIRKARGTKAGSTNL